ncbi:MAG: AAA family ATPase [Candidatus Latescibacterota bacterium]|nr:MAG: AAA family ATPase [Candidatus Latescibacterota bacterium]
MAERRSKATRGTPNRTQSVSVSREGRTAELDGVRFQLGRADQTEREWIGQGEILRQLLACWLVVDAQDLPLVPRIRGVPGIGKTTLGMAAARRRQQELYIFQCTADTRPEDLIITPVLGDDGKIVYHASPLVTAMVRGGVCILDEGNRMNEKSWASLAPLFDQRRYVESIIAGIMIPSHADFRACVTMNEDESTFEIPDYILSRLQPTLEVQFPERDDEMAILEYHLPFAERDLLDLTVDFLQRAHGLGLDFSPRDGVHIVQYAVKRCAQERAHPLSKDEAWREAVLRVLGDEALELETLAERRRRAQGAQRSPLGLGDFFFDPDDPLHPDRPLEEDDEDD